MIHCAPDAAYTLLKKFYKLFTGRDIDDSLQPIQQQLQQDNVEPFYAKPTIAKKMKDHELARIADQKRQTEMAKTVITSHNEMLRTERVDNPERFTKKTGFAQVRNVEVATAKVMSQKEQGDVKKVEVKTANKSIRVMKMEANQKRENQNKLPGGIQDEDSDEYVLDNILVDIVGQNLVNKMNKSDPEYKNFKEHYDKVIPYFTDRFQYIADELVYDIFTEMNERQEDLVNVLSRNMLDFCDLIRFFAKCFKQVNPMVTIGNEDVENKGKNIFQLMLDTLAQVANKILNTDPIQTEVYFLEYGLDELLDIMVENLFKRNEMAFLMYCFVQTSTNSHLRVLTKIKDKIGVAHKEAYFGILSRLLLYESEDVSSDIFNFYLREAAQGIYAQSPVTRTKCVSILSYFSRIQVEPILPMIPILQKMCREEYWELKGQLLILCANALLQFNTVVEEVDEDQEDSGQKKVERKRVSEDVTLEYTPRLFQIIHDILTPNAPKATIKIGLIYLAKILHFYQEYTPTYL